MPPTFADLIRAHITRSLQQEGYNAADQGSWIALEVEGRRYRITVEKED